MPRGTPPQDLVWLKDPDGVYLSCNPRLERFFGATEAEIVEACRAEFGVIPFVLNLINPKNVVLGKDLLPLQAAHSHSQSKPMPLWIG